MIAAADRPMLAQFVSRLLRLDPGAVVRLRPEPDGSGYAWAMLPFRVLVGRRLSQPPPADVTVRAADLATALTGGELGELARRDEAWRWPVPPSAGRAVEHIPVAEVRRLAEAAARTVRRAMTEGVNGRAVGERALRDALLDHVAIVVTGDDGERVEIPQRMVQALVRTGLLEATGTNVGADPGASVGAVTASVSAATESVGVSADTESIDAVAVRRTMAWIGMSSRYGSAWYRPISPLRMSRGVDGRPGTFR
ncbi:MAG: hypothetical protein IRY85_16315 [Micromonosporaceae bacterium]|nr:hypothetical protein [Micromonosporaceae bacterium]